MENLFEPVVPAKKLNSNFNLVKQNVGYEPARRMLEKVYEEFENIDGNFLQQFQTTGFDQRIFELYLFAYLKDSGFEFERGYDRPDFIIKKDGYRVAIEATTVNPVSKADTSISDEENYKDLSPEEIKFKLEQELPIKFGSPLYSKLKKKYWKLDHCQETPLILAIQSFHEEGSLRYSSTSLVNYLYGSQDKVKDGKIVQEEITEHRLHEKVIPSGFFKSPDSENISAVIFSNSGSIAKFQRMGYIRGFVSNHIKIKRSGFCYNFEKNALEPESFDYDLDEVDYDEPWGEELVVCLNPYAKHPIPKDFFPNAAQVYLHNSRVMTDIFGFTPFSSRTLIINVGGEDNELPKGIKKISKRLMDELVPERTILPFLHEKEWFMSTDKKYIGIIVFDNSDRTFNVIILKKNNNRYTAVRTFIDVENVAKAQTCIFEELNKAAL